MTARTCTECWREALPGTSRCAEHPATRHRSPTSYWTGHRRWRTVRPRILKRDRYVCQVRLVCQGDPATEVDHITPVRDGGAPYAVSNLRAACSACNQARNRKT